MPSTLTSFDQIVTQNEEMLECLQIARMAATADVTVLILGENGTGKNLLAQGLHVASPRASGPYIPVNCSALAETLLDSELFGHVKGAFTNAERDRKGKFELADRGTLFLDEIGDMSGAAQAKILRAVEDHEFEPIGSERTVCTDVRIVAATNRNLSDYVTAERFRQDLYYRLNEVVLRVPPLRERREDIPVLVNHFIRQANIKFDKEIKRVSNVTLNYLLRHDWPGNVRELRNVINFGVMMAPRDVVWIEDLSWKINDGRIAPDMGTENEDLSLDAVECRHVKRVLLITNGNKKRACELLGISRPTLNRMLRRWEAEQAASTADPVRDPEPTPEEPAGDGTAAAS
jgi:transcriptional regulator with PAS, ATPase and Fis domain